MATYLLYLGIGRFDVVRGQAGKVGLAAFTPPGRGASGTYALGIAEKVLPEYERYYGILYPLPKLDLVAVPEFWAGAMENWARSRSLRWRCWPIRARARSGACHRGDDGPRDRPHVVWQPRDDELVERHLAQ